ncbi:hypothetical protein ARMGADRAFT_62615 [Armillaria gallica]|uniref:C3H1-type domain-containing protein n=1 Tax=Armillaria gallica TaxID=47427 RepID=A0A2H3DLF0_ARMGA|nr:hypothetical protein ARMGADRAFT_62615 [Armillaria gallica]
MPVAGPSTGAPAAQRNERAAGGRNIVRIYPGAVGHLLTAGLYQPPRLAKEPMYPPGLCNFGPKDSNIRPPTNRPVPSRFNNHTVPRATYPPRNYAPRPGYSIRDEICINYQQGRCKYGTRCYRRHVLPPEYKHVEDYNPPPVKLPPPIRIETETPPGLPKVRVEI